MCNKLEDIFEAINEDRCYECSGYGDDYYTDENGDLVPACYDCPFYDGGEEHVTD